MVEPAAMNAPSPTRTGATSAESLPMKTRSPMIVGIFVKSIVIASDGACADVGLGADLRVAQVREVACLGAFAHRRLLQLDEIADVRAGFHMIVGRANERTARP